MCQLKEHGGLRCSGHIKENIDANNFAYNKLILDEGKKMGRGEEMETVALKAEAMAAKSASSTDGYVQAKAKYDSFIATYGSKVSKVHQLVNNNASVDQVARHIIENDEEYQNVRKGYETSLENYKDVLKNGNKWQVVIAKRQMIKKKAHTMDKLRGMVAIARKDAETFSNKENKSGHGFGVDVSKTNFAMKMQSKVDEARDSKDKIYEKSYKGAHQKALEESISSLKGYSELAQSIEDNPTRKSITCQERQKELQRQYAMTSENTKSLDAKIERAKKNGHTERFLRLSVEKESIAVARAKEQFDNVKESKTPKRRTILAELKTEHNDRRKLRDSFMQQHVDFIQENRVAA